MKEVGQSQIWPASFRLVDNVQFKLGQALKAYPKSTAKKIMGDIQKAYVLNVKGYDPD